MFLIKRHFSTIRLTVHHFFLQENYRKGGPNTDWNEIAQQFRAKFHTGTTAENLKNRAQNIVKKHLVHPSHLLFTFKNILNQLNVSFTSIIQLSAFMRVWLLWRLSTVVVSPHSLFIIHHFSFIVPPHLTEILLGWRFWVTFLATMPPYWETTSLWKVSSICLLRFHLPSALLLTDTHPSPSKGIVETLNPPCLRNTW